MARANRGCSSLTYGLLDSLSPLRALRYTPSTTDGMTSYTTTITPRLRVARNSLNYDRSVSQIATATESPSHLPEFSQLVDLDLNEMAPSETSEQPSSSTVPGPSTSARSENPAAVLRALLSRLPTESRSPPSQSPSQQYVSERESDYDMDLTEPANAARSLVQENLKDIFSKARRDPRDTPQKAQTRDNSNTPSEVNPNSTTNMGRDEARGKRRSSDDELDNTSGVSQRPPTRFKHSPQPVTLEFLRERFSDSRFSNGSVEDDEHPPSIHDFSSDDDAIPPQLDSFQTNIPVATSTPQQSLRMSFNSQFQSNLLDQDTEMQHAIDEFDSYGESSANRPISPPPILRKLPTSRFGHLTPIASKSQDSSKTPTTNRAELYPSSPGSPRLNDVSSDSRDYDGILDLEHDQIRGAVQSRISRGHGHSHRSTFEILDELTPRAENRAQSSRYLPSTPSRDDPLQSDNEPSDNESLRSTTPPGSPPFANTRPGQSPQTSSFPASFAKDRNYDEVDNISKAEQKWDSPHPTWSTSSTMRSLTPLPLSPIRTPNDRMRSNSLHSLDQSKARNRLQSERPDSVTDLSNQASKEDTYQSMTPLHSSPSGSGPGCTSSLQAIDNTYHHNDPSIRRRLRSLSPLPSSNKVDIKPLHTSNSSKKSRLDILSSNRKHTTPSHDWVSSTQDLSVKSTSSSQSEQPTRWSSRLDSNEEAYDKTREINLSSHENRTPVMKKDFPDISAFDVEQRPATPPSRPPSQLSSVPTIPHVLVKEQTSPSNSYKEILSSPSTTSRRTPKKINRGHKSPSPTNGPPDLPTPSSSDESDHSPWDHAVTPKPNTNASSNASRLPTPRPPGGWLQTPMPPRTSSGLSDHNVDDHSTLGHNETEIDSDNLELKTPLRAANATSGKTPRLPGAWQTPAPVLKSAYPASSDERDLEPTQDLLTPAPSFSKGSFLNPKTPYVPGGWTATPAARKSILKVRFNQGTEALSADNSLTPRPRKNHTSDEYAGKKMTTEDSSSTNLSPSRTPRHAQASNIRVLDAYGQGVSDDLNTQRSSPSRNALCVVDSMGPKVQESDQIREDEAIEEDEDYPASSRMELLSRIRRGLDNLVEDIDEIDRENDAHLKDETRMEELNALSMQARKNRERLLGQAIKLQPNHDRFESNTVLSGTLGPKSRPSNRRLYAIMLLVQILLVLMMYRLSVHRARELFLNSYYDPFNPDLYLYVFKYDTSFQLFNANFSRSSQWSFGGAFLQGGKAFASCVHLLGDVKSYLWKLWAIEASSLHTTTWAPT